MHNIWQHDVAERMAIRRKLIAKESGLEDYDVGTYPAEDNSINISSGAVATVLALLMGAGAGGFVLSNFLNPEIPDPVVEERVYDYEVDTEVIPPPR